MNAALFVAENLGICVGYFTVGLYVIWILPRTRLRTRVAAFFFFLTCGLTHFDQAYHTLFQPREPYHHIAQETHMLAIHTAQVVAVWLFLIWWLQDNRALNRHLTGSPHGEG